MNKLLIYIPSYNRYDLLVKLLDALVQSVYNDTINNICIVVSDNASTDKRYLELAKQYEQEYIIIKRNRINIGAVANVIRGFEFDEYDYIWILSDDDIVKPEALRVISKEINEGEHDFFYLKCNIKGDERVSDGEVIRTQEEYFINFATLSMMGLISANIYSSRIKDYIEYMYLYGYTLFPHLAALLKLMENENFTLKCIGGNLVEWVPNNRSYNHIYEMALMNFLALTELLNNKKNRRLLINAHVNDFGASHYFPAAIKSPYNIKKAITQVGFYNFFKVCILGLILQLGITLFHKFKEARTFFKFHGGI